MFASSSFPLALYLLWHSTGAQNSEIICPATGFTVGVNATVTCMVNKSDFDSACGLPATFINFYFTPKNGAKSEWCSSSYKTCPNTGTTQVDCGTCSCGCETKNTTFLTHRLDFVPTSAHADGNFSCEVICFSSVNLPTLTNTNCDQVTVAPPDTSAPGTNLLYLLLLLLLIPIVVVIIIVWYCFCNNGGINGTKKAKEEELGSSSQNQQTTNGNKTVDEKGAHNGEKVSKPVQETELTKVKKTSSAPSGEEETSLNGPRSV